ncbi:MAG: hypothetical protein JWQ66_3700 [Mucilaginibacter sp.]|nr:hypothetical protein [Mucilaginibacter sp.]
METIEQEVSVHLQRHNYYNLYRVNKNDTTIKTISTNNFKPVKPRPYSFMPAVYTLQPCVDDCYYFVDLVSAMEKAKAGALAYIELLIGEGEAGMAALLQYRMDHYEDLHINLVDANIQLVEQQLMEDRHYKWTPYRINN